MEGQQKGDAKKAKAAKEGKNEGVIKGWFAKVFQVDHTIIEDLIKALSSDVVTAWFDGMKTLAYPFVIFLLVRSLLPFVHLIFEIPAFLKAMIELPLEMLKTLEACLERTGNLIQQLARFTYALWQWVDGSFPSAKLLRVRGSNQDLFTPCQVMVHSWSPLFCSLASCLGRDESGVTMSSLTALSCEQLAQGSWRGKGARGATSSHECVALEILPTSQHWGSFGDLMKSEHYEVGFVTESASAASQSAYEALPWWAATLAETAGSLYWTPLRWVPAVPAVVAAVLVLGPKKTLAVMAFLAAASSSLEMAYPLTLINIAKVVMAAPPSSPPCQMLWVPLSLQEEFYWGLGGLITLAVVRLVVMVTKQLAESALTMSIAAYTHVLDGVSEVTGSAKEAAFGKGPGVDGVAEVTGSAKEAAFGKGPGVAQEKLPPEGGKENGIAEVKAERSWWAWVRGRT